MDFNTLYHKTGSDKKRGLNTSLLVNQLKRSSVDVPAFLAIDSDFDNVLQKS